MDMRLDRSCLEGWDGDIGRLRMLQEAEARSKFEIFEVSFMYFTI